MPADDRRDLTPRRREGLPPAAEAAVSRDRAREPRDPRRALRLGGGTVRMRQVDAAQSRLGPPSRDDGRGDAPWHPRDRRAHRRRLHLPARRAAPLAYGARERRAAAALPWPARPRACEGVDLPRRARPLRRQLSARAVRRYAEAGAARAVARRRPAGPPHGRAVQRARRADAQPDGERAPERLESWGVVGGRSPPDGPLHHG